MLLLRRIWSRGWLISSLLLLLHSSPASAHLLKVFAYTEGSMVQGSSYFAGGSAAAGARITIFDAQDQTVAELNSDAQGEFSFQLGKPGNLRIVADTGDGHQAEWWLAEQQASTSLPASAANSDQNSELALLVEQAVERAVARQVGPLQQQLDRFSHRTKLADIIGGLGFIFGLTGLLMWWRSRN